jgi:hypothetical protein
MSLQQRQKRIAALIELIKENKQISIKELRLQLISKWGLSEKTSDEYVRCLTYDPLIYVESGYIKSKQ